jgi:rSAM/selenodomain-associated transferase 1
MSPTRIVIMAKAPLAGFAKTRLIPALGADGAAALARRMFERTLQSALAAEVGPVELCVAPEPADLAWQALAVPGRVAWSAQCAGDLGARMADAVQRTVYQGERVVLIGTDCPSLSTEHLRAAATGLSDHDAVLIPSTDGGYVLLGLKRFDPILFDNMPWSTHTVTAETLNRLQGLARSTQTLPALHDIDEPADLQWLPKDWADHSKSQHCDHF